jgi:hypothetical protein
VQYPQTIAFCARAGAPALSQTAVIMMTIKARNITVPSFFCL